MESVAGSFVWVDDAEDFRERVRTVAEGASLGNEPSLSPVFADGKDALRAVIADVEAQRRDVPKFIVLDLDLEDESYTGIQALRDIRRSPRLTHCPIVIHSHHLGQQSVHESYSYQANSVVQKPGKVREQSKTILELIRYWSLVNRTAA